MRARLPGQRQVVVDNPVFERRWRMNLGCDAHVVLLGVWESTLYRMVGRGALWTQDEIKQMADYLGATYGKKP